MGADQPSFVYIMASHKGGTLYVGVTSDLVKRVHDHKTGVTQGFVDRYGLSRLVWFEVHSSIEEAIKREKRIKRWLRAWKFELIEKTNPEWRDLYSTII